MQDPLYNYVDQILVPHTAFQTAIARIGQCYKASYDNSEPICIPILGPSRTGKSRLKKHFLAKHPKQRLDDGMHIPILSVTTPPNPTPKGIAGVMLRAIGDPSPHKGSETTNLTP